MGPRPHLSPGGTARGWRGSLRQLMSTTAWACAREWGRTRREWVGGHLNDVVGVGREGEQFCFVCYTRQGKGVILSVQGRTVSRGRYRLSNHHRSASLSVGVALRRCGCHNMWRPCTEVAAPQVLRGSSGVGVAACGYAWVSYGARDPGVIYLHRAGSQWRPCPTLFWNLRWCMSGPPCSDTDQAIRSRGLMCGGEN